MTTFDETATRRRPRGFRRPERSARAASDVHAGHGGRRLALGVAVAAAFLVAAHLVHAVLLIEYFPPGLGPWPAWIVLAAAVGLVTAATAANGFLMPPWLAVAAALAVVAVAVLDVMATLGLVAGGVTPTAAPAACAALLPVAALGPTRPPLVTACLVATALAAEAVAQAAAGPAAAYGLLVALSAILPMAVAAIGIDRFRRLVRREVDLSLVQSTIATPRSAVGMWASEELAQLDFDAESLLEDVGSGRIPIPVPRDVAESASAIAGRLRVRLIEGRTDTWLRHAVTESQYLSDRVRVDDSEGYAGQLGQTQREGLLLALWLIVGDNRRRATATATVRISLADLDFDEDDPADLVVVIEAAGILPRHIDPAMWDAVATIGLPQTITRTGGFRIVIRCTADAADSPSPHLAPQQGARTHGG